jgi:hypothetical protein
VVFPQKDDPAKRVFPEAKLSTCIPILRKRPPTPDSSIEVLTFPGNSLRDMPKRLRFGVDDLQIIDSKILPIPVCDQAELEIALRIHRDAARLEDKCLITRGEINQTVCRKYISSDSAHRPLLKGVEVRLFGFNEDLSQGEREYFNERKYEREKQQRRPPTIRIATQRITGVDERRRLVCALSSNGAYFADSTNSIQSLEGVSPFLIIGLLNSRLLNWRFDLTSTNNNVGTNELEAMPFPNNLDESVAREIERVSKALTEGGGIRVKDSFTTSDLDELDGLDFSLYRLTRAEIETVMKRKAP